MNTTSHFQEGTVRPSMGAQHPGQEGTKGNRHAPRGNTVCMVHISQARQYAVQLPSTSSWRVGVRELGLSVGCSHDAQSAMYRYAHSAQAQQSPCFASEARFIAAAMP